MKTKPHLFLLLILLAFASLLVSCLHDPIESEPAGDHYLVLPATQRGTLIQFFQSRSMFMEGEMKRATQAYSDPYQIRDARVENNRLLIDVGYGGGCSQHRFDVIWDGNKNNNTISLILRHYGNNDNCFAMVSETLSIDLRCLAPKDGPLNIKLINPFPEQEITLAN